MQDGVLVVNYRYQNTTIMIPIAEKDDRGLIFVNKNIVLLQYEVVSVILSV